ncbi:MAG: 4Fe-4S binding protein [Deltaproteobacteria bacterium]|nr:4Fe-4S binding protein [Deltaproteobacteria bacterium]
MAPRRQRLRRSLIIISFILFPITIFYFSPVLIIMGATAGVLAGAAIVFLCQFLSALILGRAFCGWICPAGGLQEACFPAQARRVNGKKSDWIKYLIWVPWMGTIIYLFTQSGIHGVDFFFMMESPISLSSPAQYPIYISVTALIFVLALTVGRRGFCHTACWMAPFMVAGAKFSRFLPLPTLYLRADADKCVECRDCTAQCPMSLDVPAMVQHGNMHNNECILCGSCIDACQRQSLSYAFGVNPVEKAKDAHLREK